MRKRTRKIERSIKAPILGFGVLLTSILVFLLFLCILIVLARVVLG
ncbi:hypothetical protein [Raoultibacter massiliensis]